MSCIDPFGRTDKLDDGTLEALAVRFEARGKHPLFSKMLYEYLGAMNIPPSANVLDMGCGTGLAARAIARRAGFSGKVRGVDLSPYLVSVAQRLALEEGLRERVEFRAGDVRTIDFGDGTFDAVAAHTLLSHVDDPLFVLRQAARLIRPGGTIGIFDGDYASLTFDQPDPLNAKFADDAVIRAVVTNPRVMRQMPRMLREAGLELVSFFSHVLAEAGSASFWSSAIEVYRRLVAKAGAMTEEQANAWSSTLRCDSDAGVFFASCNYYAYVARRP